MVFNESDVDLSPDECLEVAISFNEDGELLTGLWWVGVLLSILASITGNLGVNLQKFSMIREIKKVKNARAQLDHKPGDPSVEERSYIRQPLWLAGLVLVILGSVGDFVALGFVAQSLAAPVGGFTIVVNVFFGHFWLKERITRRDLFATFLVVAGVVLVAISADKTEKEFSLDCLLLLYTRPVFIVYAIGVILICVVLLVVSKVLAKKREAFLTLNDPINTEIVDDQEQKQINSYSRFQKIHPIFPAALSGIIGSQSVLFAKSTAESIKIAIRDGFAAVFTEWEPYVIILCMLITIFSQLHWLAHGLRFFDAVLIVPIFQCFFIIGGVVGGAVFFAEFKNLSAGDRKMFFSGLAITLIGVYLLSRREDNFECNEDCTPQEELKHRIKYKSGSVGSFHESFDNQSSSNPLYNSIGHRRNSSHESAASQTPLGLQMAQLSLTDFYNGIKDEINLRRLSVDRNSALRSTLRRLIRSRESVVTETADTQNSEANEADKTSSKKTEKKKDNIDNNGQKDPINS